MRFKDWLFTEGFDTHCKLGLYPPIDDALGQYPPLYAAARSPDLITYYYIQYGKKGVESKDGYVYYRDDDPRIKNAKMKVNK